MQHVPSHPCNLPAARGPPAAALGHTCSCACSWEGSEEGASPSSAICSFTRRYLPEQPHACC